MITIDNWDSALNTPVLDKDSNIASIIYKANCAPVYIGIKIVFGVRPPKPIAGAPDGKQRLRLRNNCAASLFVKTSEGIRHFKLEDLGDHWFCNQNLEQGRNLRS